MSKITVEPHYDCIQAVRSVCKPWIEMWSGDEWGESMRNALGACHTSYGFSDEDCAAIAEILINNLLPMYEWAYEYSDGLWGYGWDGEEGGAKVLAKTRKEASKVREECLNRDQWPYTKYPESYDRVEKLFASMPSWLFEPEPHELEDDEYLKLKPNAG